MKSLHAACLIAFLPTLAFAQSAPPPDAAAKPPVLYPVLPKDHEGLGRIGVRISYDKTTGLPQISVFAWVM